MPTNCECGRPFSVDHSLNCLKGRFPALRHNVVCDLIPSEVCHDVRVEPHLQPLTKETMRHRTANTDTKARSDICACVFWESRFEKVMMHGCAHHQSQCQIILQSHPWSLFQTTWARRGQYDQCVKEVKHACIILLCYIVTLYIMSEPPKWQAMAALPTYCYILLYAE